MTQLNGSRIRHVVCVAGLLLGTAACGSSTDSGSAATTPGSDPVAETASDSTAAPDATATGVADDSATAETTAPAETAPPEATGGGSGEMQIELNDGRTWALTTSMCTYNPDATGPAAAIFNLAGSNDDGVELNAIEAWPLDGSTENGTAFIGNFVDENEDLYIFVTGSATMVDGTVELTTDYQTDVFYEEGDEPVGTVTVRCTS